MSVYSGLAVIFMLFGACLAVENEDVTVLNITLASDTLKNMSNMVAVLSGRVQIQCEEGPYNLYNIPKANYEGCDFPGENVIGSCVDANSQLVINIKSIQMSFSGIVSYNIGKTYYFGAYITNSNNEVVSNQPCVDGIKFSFTVLSKLPEETTLSSSETVMVAPTSSLSISPSPSAINIDQSSSLPLSLTVSNILPSTATMSSSSSSTAVPTVTRPVGPTNTNNPTSRPTTEPADINDIDDLTNPFSEGIADGGSSVTSSIPFLLTCLTIVLLMIHKLL